VVEAWQMARERHPELQLAIVLMTDPIDPAGRACYEELARVANDEPAITLVSSGNEFGNVELNVFQRAAAVVLQKGLRKGFGLWVADAMWKERPCVVAAVPGLQEQVIDRETGLVVQSTRECASAIVRLLEHPEEAKRYGVNGHNRVAERFLITRYLRDYLTVLNDLHRTN
jgi:trehalose synthase